MTAINVFRSAAAVHVCTDGLTYGPNKTFLMPKVYVAVHVPLLIAIPGLMGAAHCYAARLHEAFDGFDELVAGIESAFPAMHASVMKFVPDANDHQARDAELTIAGYSRARQQCEAYYIRGGEPDGPDEWLPPWRLVEVEMDGTVCAPPPSDRLGIDPAHIDRDMVRIMEAQRRDFPRVGGFCQLTTLTQHTVTQRILRRWS